jgi:phage portal protein BeeE
VALWLLSSGSGSNAAINYKKSHTAVYNAVEQISNDIAKYRFPLTKKQQPRIKTQSSSTQACFFSPNSNDIYIFVKQWLFRCFLRGNALARIVYDASGNPIETIRDKVTDIRINKGELLYYVQGFTNPLLASEYAFQELLTTES